MKKPIAKKRARGATPTGQSRVLPKGAVGRAKAGQPKRGAPTSMAGGRKPPNKGMAGGMKKPSMGGGMKKPAAGAGRKKKPMGGAKRPMKPGY